MKFILTEVKKPDKILKKTSGNIIEKNLFACTCIHCTLNPREQKDKRKLGQR